jgi:hypothetical protein
LVANKDFLIRSVEVKYGLSEAGEEYLDKFFDFSIMFEEGSPYRSSAPGVLYARKIFSQLIDDRTSDAREMEAIITEIAGAYNLTFRQVEKITTNAALAYGAFGEREYRPSFMVAFLCFLKAIHPKVYESIKQRKFHYKAFHDLIKQGDWEEHSVIHQVLVVFEYHSIDDIDVTDDRFKGYSGSLNSFHFRDRRDVLPS